MFQFRMVTFFLGFCLLVGIARADTTLILLDNSGSMNGSLASKTKTDEARREIRDTFIPGLTAGGRAALWTFGGDCNSMGFQGQVTSDGGRLQSDLSGIGRPSGSTPLSWAVGQALTELQRHPEPRHLIVVTDGKDTCGGDPCAEINRGRAAQTQVTVHTVGLGMGKRDSAFRVLECMAQAGAPGGTADVVAPGGSLKDSVRKIVGNIQEKRRGSLLVRVVDSRGREQSVAYTAVSADTGQKFTGKSGLSLSLPAGEYRIEGSLPETRTVDITPDKTEEIRLASDLGHLIPYSNCGKDLAYAVLDEKDQAVAASTLANREGVALPPGNYTVKLTKYPNLPAKPATIVRNAAMELNVGSFGNIKIAASDAAGNPFHLPLVFYDDARGEVGTGATSEEITFPVGVYNVAVESTHSMAGLMTGGGNIRITECQTTNASLQQEAAIKVCGAGGHVRVISDSTGQSYEGRTGELIGVPPGVYNVLPDNAPAIANVRVEKGVKTVNCP